jgi:hypothetical protein
MHDVKELVERLQPAATEPGDWAAVLRDAGARRPMRLARPLAGLAAAAAGVFALALFQPWQSQTPTLLERALAAVGEGPVLHVVLRGEWGGTNVDLETGERTPVHGENETWYDAERGVVHTVLRLGDVVQSEQLYEPVDPPQHLVALARDYREALRSGTARVTEEAVIEGERVSWITIHSEMLPDVADGKLHEWAQQVAVSQETAEPMATRETRDGEAGPFTRQRILSLELLPAGRGDFTAPKADQLESNAFSFQPFGEVLTTGEAAQVLGRQPLWAGRRVGDLDLTGIGETETRVFRSPPVRRDGQTIRKVDWKDEIASARGVVLFYGDFGDDPSTFRKSEGPLWERPHVAITEATRLLVSPRAGTYVPPDGSLFLRAGRRAGALERDGIYVIIEASSEELVLEAARALEPMPR